MAIVRYRLYLTLSMYGLKIENLQGYDQIAQYYFHPGEYDSEVDGEGIDDEDGGSDEE